MLKSHSHGMRASRWWLMFSDECCHTEIINVFTQVKSCLPTWFDLKTIFIFRRQHTTTFPVLGTNNPHWITWKRSQYLLRFSIISSALPLAGGTYLMRVCVLVSVVLILILIQFFRRCLLQNLSDLSQTQHNDGRHNGPQIFGEISHLFLLFKF